MGSRKPYDNFTKNLKLAYRQIIVIGKIRGIIFMFLLLVIGLIAVNYSLVLGIMALIATSIALMKVDSIREFFFCDIPKNQDELRSRLSAKVGSMIELSAFKAKKRPSIMNEKKFKLDRSFREFLDSWERTERQLVGISGYSLKLNYVEKEQYVQERYTNSSTNVFGEVDVEQGSRQKTGGYLSQFDVYAPSANLGAVIFKIDIYNLVSAVAPGCNIVETYDIDWNRHYFKQDTLVLEPGKSVSFSFQTPPLDCPLCADITLDISQIEVLCQRPLYSLTGHTNSVTAVAITPDGKRAVSASWDKTLKLWDLERGTELATLKGHSNGVNAVAITPDGKRAVSRSGDKTLKLWDLERGTELATLKGHSNGVNAVAITPDGKRAVLASNDKTLKLWDLETGTELATFRGHSGSVNAVAITPNGFRAVSASNDKTLKLWDLERGTELATLIGHSDYVNAVAITPDGKRAVSASDDETLKLWDLETRTELTTLRGHSSRVMAVAITPDGKRAVSASQDKTLKLWDLATGSKLATLSGHSSYVNAVAITPDGKQAVSASYDNTLKVWDLTRIYMSLIHLGIVHQ